MRLLLRWGINTIAILVTAYLLPLHLEVTSVPAAIVAALLLGILNTVVRPIFKLLALPITVLTLGLFILVINGAILQILAWLMGDSFNIKGGFVWAIIATLFISVVTTAINIIVGTDNRTGSRRYEQ